MHILKLHQADLSLETLRSIKSDLFKYSHLNAYKNDFKDLIEVIKAREIAAQYEKREAQQKAS